MGLLSWVLFGGLAGLVAGMLVGGRGGIIWNVITGIVGALVGGFIMNQFGEAGVIGWDWKSFLVAVGGAIVFILLLRLLRGGKKG